MKIENRQQFLVMLTIAAFALLIGPSVQWAFKLFDVHPHRPDDAIPPDAVVED